MKIQYPLIASLLIPLSGGAVDYPITSNADFDLGVLQSLNHDTSGQLQISSILSTFPVLWVANAGEDTMSKIDTDNDCEVARYETWFSSGNHSPWGGPAPSRTAVDSDGNVFVANRHFDNKPVSVLKVLLEGGIDRNGNGVIDTSRDLNNDCRIQPSEMIPLIDLNANNVLEDHELADERVAFVEQIPNTNGHLGRSLCIAGDGDIWVGTYYGNRAYYELDPGDGHVKAGPIDTGVGNYGCVIDGKGILYGATLSNRMPVIDTNTHTFLPPLKTHSGTDYSIAAGNGKIYKARAGSPYLIYDPVTGLFSVPGKYYSTSYGIGVDGNGDIVQGNTAIRKFKGSDNSLIWASTNPSGSGNTRGIIPDSNNNIWAINLSSNNATKFKGSDGQYLNTVPTGYQPYTYSDASGIGFQVSNPNGVFTRIVDSGSATSEWDSVSWNDEPEGSEPAGSSIQVEVRVANTMAGLPLETYGSVTNGTTGLSQIGQFIQVRATLTPDGTGNSPVLSDITLSTKVALACDIDLDGDVDRNDISMIIAARNTTAAAGDPRDNDGNGVIDVNDARQCSIQCTLPRCAVQ